MEKFIVLLTVVAMLLFFFMTVPVHQLQADNLYVVCDSDFWGDKILKNSEKWSTENGFVYKLARADMEKAQIIPCGKVVREYITDEANSINMRNPFLQKNASQFSTVYGIPYVID